MTLSVDIVHRQGAFTLEAAFESGGRLTALFGPSGSGKTTLVNLIGGLIRPQQGRIVAGGRVLVDTQAGVFVPPHRRRIGYVFQDARLFPHLTVRQNLRYGAFFTPARERYAELASVVDMLGIGSLLDRRPALLSGGEKQRVAIGRALLASPLLVLMDEPLASLDDARKAEILPYLERLRDELKVPIVYVSHSLAEVARLATDIVILREGGVETQGAAGDVLVGAGMLGDLETVLAQDEPAVVLELQVTGYDAQDGLAVLRSSAGEWRLPMRQPALGSRIRIRLAASDVIVATEQPRGISALNVIPGVVEALSGTQTGGWVVVVRSGTDRILASVTRRSAKALGLSLGRPVHAVVKSFAVGRIPTPDR